MRPFSKDKGKAAERAAVKLLPNEDTNGTTNATPAGAAAQAGGEGVVREVEGGGGKSEGSQRSGGRGLPRPAPETIAGMRRRTKLNPATKKNPPL